MMPLIRLSEVILIAAECSSTLNQGTSYLNALRTIRHCVSLAPTTTAQLKEFITREFRKEMIGEGQTYFYFKRNSMTLLPNQASATGGTKSVTLSYYNMPLPASETALRVN
jgi:hypothetical protein